MPVLCPVCYLKGLDFLSFDFLTSDLLHIFITLLKCTDNFVWIWSSRDKIVAPLNVQTFILKVKKINSNLNQFLVLKKFEKLEDFWGSQFAAVCWFECFLVIYCDQMLHICFGCLEDSGVFLCDMFILIPSFPLFFFSDTGIAFPESSIFCLCLDIVATLCEYEFGMGKKHFWYQ